MKKIKIFFVFTLIISASLFGVHSLVFKTPALPTLASVTFPELNENLRCYDNPNAEILDEEGLLRILVWNIYKQNRANWEIALTEFSTEQHLLLLQEASMTDSFKQWIGDHQWFGNQVDAFKAFDITAGVLNLSQVSPFKACAYVAMEPWLRLPKSAIYALYPLSNGDQLAVVNIHAVNFTYGTAEYHEQIGILATELLGHKGPIIVAGDFNSWSEERVNVMKSSLQKLAMKEVQFLPDHRKEFITGLALDHVFYRGLTVKNAKAPESSASDHNPLMVEFELEDVTKSP